MDSITIDREKLAGYAEQMLKSAAQHRDTQLLDEPDLVHLSFSYKLVPLGTKCIKIKLPHSMHWEKRSVALFVKDQDRKDREYEKSERKYQDILRAKGVTGISEIIPLKALKLEYKAFESKLQLSMKHNIFLADETIIRLLPSQLGKHFYGRKKNPVQVNMRAQDLKKEIQAALDNTRCYLTGRGSSCTCVVGHTDMEPSQIADNIAAAAEQIAANIPGGPKNVRNFSVKTLKSKAFKIYKDKGSKMEVQLPARPQKRKLEDFEAEEITTLYGAKVRVLPNGIIKVIPDGASAKKQRKRVRGPRHKSGTKGRTPAKGKAKKKVKAKAKSPTQDKVQTKPAGEGKVKAAGEGKVKAAGEGKVKAAGEGNAKKQAKGKAKPATQDKVKAAGEGKVKAKPPMQTKVQTSGKKGLERKRKPKAEA